MSDDIRAGRRVHGWVREEPEAEGRGKELVLQEAEEDGDEDEEAVTGATQDCRADAP